MTDALKRLIQSINGAIKSSPILPGVVAEKPARLSNKDEISNRAVFHFVEGDYNCSEAIGAAFAESRGEDPEIYRGCLSPFGGGIAGQGKTCGALTASLLLAGKEGASRGMDKKEIQKISGKLFQNFSEAFHSDACETLSQHNCNADGAASFDIKHCAPFLKKAMEDLIDISEASN